MDPAIKTLLTFIRHRAVIGNLLTRLAHDIERRGANHDLSKFGDLEFPGFVEVNQAARDHAFGSPEYKAALVGIGKPGGCFYEHAQHNRHHPEHFRAVDDMTFVDLIEMVCDWHAAAVTYGNNSLRESLPHQYARFEFTSEQRWLIEQVVSWIESGSV